MSLRHQFRKLLLIGFVVLALLSGAPMRPEEIEELLHQFNKPKIAHVLRDENENRDIPED